MYVKQVAFVYNTYKHASTHFSPIYIIHGHEAWVPADVLVPSSDLDSHGLGSLTEYESSIAERLELAFSAASLTLQKLMKDRNCIMMRVAASMPVVWVCWGVAEFKFMYIYFIEWGTVLKMQKPASMYYFCVTGNSKKTRQYNLIIMELCHW